MRKKESENIFLLQKLPTFDDKKNKDTREFIDEARQILGQRGLGILRITKISSSISALGLSDFFYVRWLVDRTGKKWRQDFENRDVFLVTLNDDVVYLQAESNTIDGRSVLVLFNREKKRTEKKEKEKRLFAKDKNRFGIPIERSSATKDHLLSAGKEQHFDAFIFLEKLR